MRPFDKQILSSYIHAGHVWEYKSGDAGEDLGQAVQLAWQREFGEPIDLDNICEPYDLGAADMLYVLPRGRFLFISASDASVPRYRACAEIRAVMPLYFLNNGQRVLSTFNAKDRLSAIERLTTDILPKLPSQPPVWQFYERLRPDTDAEIILEEKGL